LEIPLAYALAVPLRFESNGAYYAIVVAECAMAAAGVLLFRRGRWKRQQI
jgi:Na+-driven multidrug efflux pump